MNEDTKPAPVKHLVVNSALEETIQKYRNTLEWHRQSGDIVQKARRALEDAEEDHRKAGQHVQALANKLSAEVSASLVMVK